MPSDEFKLSPTGLLDLNSTRLTSYSQDTYIKVLDNVFTAQECNDLLEKATSSGAWEPAKVLTTTGDKLYLDYRNSSRILLFDHQIAETIFQKLRPYVQEIEEIRPSDKWEGIVGSPGKVRGVWKLLGINERLSFLKYNPGNFFNPHCDGQLELKDGRKSRVTLQIYLNDDNGLKGGSTRIFDGRSTSGPYLDIHPKLGRVLIFQQRGVVHSGEPVLIGEKYALRSDFMFDECTLG